MQSDLRGENAGNEYSAPDPGTGALYSFPAFSLRKLLNGRPSTIQSAGEQ